MMQSGNDAEPHRWAWSKVVGKVDMHAYSTQAIGPAPLSIAVIS